MMTVHLDDRAIFMSRWRDLMLQTLSAADREDSEARRELRRAVRETWTGRASVDSAAYRIVREFRTQVGELAFAPLIERIRQVDTEYSPLAARGAEGALWALVSERPLHLLDPRSRFDERRPRTEHGPHHAPAPQQQPEGEGGRDRAA